MTSFPPKKQQTVDVSGAAAGSVLLGTGLNNQGLRLRVLRDQAPGDGGAIRGDFVILSTGVNLHAESLDPLLHRTTNAEEVVRVIRRRHPGCVNAVNANILALEPRDPEGAPSPGRN
jgi:hypothetical protein